MQLGDDCIPAVLIHDFYESLHVSSFIYGLSASDIVAEMENAAIGTISFAEHPDAVDGKAVSNGRF